MNDCVTAINGSMTEMAIWAVADCGAGVVLSVTRSVIGKLPGVVTVPVRSPPSVRVRLTGSDPFAIDQWNPGVPLDAWKR